MEENKMNFLEAVKAMGEGKKVERDNKRLFQLEDTTGEIIQIVTRNDEKNVRALLMEDYKATDWQIIEEKKTLSSEWLKGDGLSDEEIENIKCPNGSITCGLRTKLGFEGKCNLCKPKQSSLSDKGRWDNQIGIGNIKYLQEDVKEFIKDIKEEISFPESVVEPQIAKEIIKVINEKAGERLI